MLVANVTETSTTVLLIHVKMMANASIITAKDTNVNVIRAISVENVNMK